MNPLGISLERSPELFPLALAPGLQSVLLIRMTEREYEAASFLDARLLTPQVPSRAIPWPQLEETVRQTGLAEACDFIFHIGHVGSTLLSRLVGKHPVIFALREPMILRTLAQSDFEPGSGESAWSGPDYEARLSTFLKLWSRTFRPEQRACIKATSFVSEIATDLLARPFGPKAIFVFVLAETYLASILGGQNSRQELKMLAQSRLERLHRLLGNEPWALNGLSEGETIAMSWACEMTALAEAAAGVNGRVLWWDFDRFFDAPDRLLRAALNHLGVETDDRAIREILSGPEMSRYSKAPEYAYDAALRRDVLNQARAEFGNEIGRGLAWLDRASAQFPIIRAATEISVRN